MIATFERPPDPACISRFCATAVSESKRRSHFNQLRNLGFTVSEANNASGRCGRCLRKFLQGRRLAS